MHKPSVFYAKIVHRELLNKPGATRNTWHIVLDIAGSNIQYRPGDCVAVRPDADPASTVRPRLYSIASSQRHAPNEIHLCVLEVEYEEAGEKKMGVCSSFLASRCPMNIPACPVYIQPTRHFLLPAPSAPIVMIGAGTGIAPFRAFLQEREQKTADNTWLFFGERTREHEFFFEEFLLQHAMTKALKLSLAFSRDASEKQYVTHRMWEEKEELVRWLERGASIYVSGSAARLGKSVEMTLQDILKEYFVASEAREYYLMLRKTKRYLLDVY